LLERGAKLIETRFEKQPALRAELYGAVGRLYVELGQHQLGSEFGNQQLQILRKQRAADRTVAQSLMLLSEAAFAANRDADAESYAQQAVDLARRLGSALARLACAQPTAKELATKRLRGSQLSRKNLQPSGHGLAVRSRVGRWS
jgi:hypothetical protein